MVLSPSGKAAITLEQLAEHAEGLFLLTGLSFFVARAQSIAPWKVIGEHLLIALCVVAITHVVGDWVQGWRE
mgnify:CR=1 FL=1